MKAASAPESSRDEEIPIATPLELGRETRQTAIAAPRSSLKPAAALTMARAVAAQVPGAKVSTVLPTGSMRPMFNERAFLVSEPAHYDELEVGDIVTYWHPKRKKIVVHRILERRSAGLWTKGDHNARPDDIYVTPDDKVMRVFAIIYAHDDSNTTLRGSGAAASRR